MTALGKDTPLPILLIPASAIGCLMVMSALLMLGIMRFGLVNAAFGRPTGDAVLQGVARRIERVIDRIGLGNAMVARTAGSEFVIALGPP